MAIALISSVAILLSTNVAAGPGISADGTYVNGKVTEPGPIGPDGYLGVYAIGSKYYEYVSVRGRSVTGETFVCYVMNSSPNYARMARVLNTAQVGTNVTAMRDVNSSECKSIYVSR